QFVDPRHHLERVRDIEHVGFAARPAAIGIKVDGPALGDEAPANGVGLLAVAAGRETLWVTRRSPSLTDLVEMAHEGQRGLVLAAEIDQRFAAAERSLRVPKKIQNDG